MTIKQRVRLTKEDRKSQILQSAMEMFVQNGFDSTTTASIAKAANISEVTLFRYFSSKQQLFDEIMQPILSISSIEDSQIDENTSVKSKLIQLLLMRLNFIKENQGLIKLILLEHDRLQLKENFIKRMALQYKEQLGRLNVHLDDFHLRLLIGLLLSYLYFSPENESEQELFVSNLINLMIK